MGLLSSLLNRLTKGEKTGSQKPKIAGDVQSLWDPTPGSDPFKKPDPGTYKTYREMRKNPTIAMARMLATAPVRTAEWSLEADEGVPAARVDFIKAQLDKHWPGPRQ